MEFGAKATFREQLAAAASTDLFVSAHTSNLANALFLRPGAAVLEVLMRNWAWEGAAGHAHPCPACLPSKAGAHGSRAASLLVSPCRNQLAPSLQDAACLATAQAH